MDVGYTWYTSEHCHENQRCIAEDNDMVVLVLVVGGYLDLHHKVVHTTAANAGPLFGTRDIVVHSG